MEAKVGQKPGYRPDIEGLRGLAVGLVVAYHASPTRFHGGFIGVTVFFVISGYLITGLLMREIDETGRLSLPGFYARRARRLLPASSLVFLSTLLVCSLFLSPLQQYRLQDSATYTALYISNLWFLRRSTDYFATGTATNPFLHTWSLAVEEQFYLVWPAIVLLAMRGLRSRRALIGMMMLITVTSMALSVWFGARLAPFAFFSPFARAWEFGVGALAFLLAPLESRLPAVVRALVSWLGLAAILLAGALLDDRGGWRGWHALLPVMGTAAILIGRTPSFSASKVLEIPFMQWIGQLSYSWYLWHWPLLAVVAVMSEGDSFSQRLHEVILCVAASFGLAVVTHYCIENPVRFSRYLAQRKALSMIGIGMVTLVTSGTALLWQHSAKEGAFALQGGRMAQAIGDSNRSGSGCPAVGFLGADVVECVGGNPASKVTVVLFGDSHAGQWFPAFKEIANDRGWRVVLIRKPACPTAQLTIFSIALNRPYIECGLWREAAIKHIVSMHPAAVVLANRQMQNFSSGLKGRDETWREGSRKTLEALDSAGLATILLRDTPSPGIDIPDCLSGDSSWWATVHATGHNPCILNRAAALNEGVFHAEEEAAAGLTHVHLLDLSDLFCDSVVCQPVKNGIVVYSDESHISEPFALSLASALGDRLVPLIQTSRL